MSSLRARLANRHAEKLIPPAELQHIQQLWDDSNRAEKVEIFNELDSYNTDQVKRLFQLIARQRKTFCKKTVLYDLFEGNGVKSLISIREASVKERVKGQSVTTLTDVLQSNLDSSLDINQVTLDSSVLPRLYHVSLQKRLFIKLFTGRPRSQSPIRRAISASICPWSPRFHFLP